MEHQQRPNGSTATGIGWALIAVGVLAAFFTASAETSGGWILGLALSNLGVGLGVLLVSLGYLVRAIWYLPGRDVAAQTESATASTASSTATTCEWCERVLPAGKTTCTSLPSNQLAEVAHLVSDPACLQQFEQRGILSETPDG